MAETNVVEKQPVTDEYLKKMDAYWRAANYLGAAQLYLLDNPLLREPLTMEHVKKKIVGHWGTVPGQNFVYSVAATPTPTATHSATASEYSTRT